MIKRVPAGGLLLLALVACGRDSSGPDVAQPTAARPEPVVVYAAHDDPTYWPGKFTGFTRATGIRVTVRHRDAATIVNEVIQNHGSPPADILLTPSVYGVWQAADEGALRLLRSDVIETRVDEALRDPDGYWVAVRARTAVIVHSADFQVSGITGFADLGDAAYRGQLCLATSSLPLYRVLIATLIGRHGSRDAELAVRHWVQNLALPPFDDESSLREAIDEGRCKLGILSSDAAAGLSTIDAASAVAYVVDIDGIGIARHAREPESALKLIEWLVISGSAELSTIDDAGPVAGAAWRIDDAIRLAERAGYH